MAIDAYAATVPAFVRMLDSLDALLDKGKAFADGRGLSEEALLSARLYPDMLPLTRQIQLASDTAKGAGARLSGAAVPSWPDEEKTFAEVKARVAKTRDYLKGLDRAAFVGAEGREIVLKFPSTTLTYGGADYIFQFAIPNFLFHVTTAYAILRAIGVPLGKNDFLGGRG